MSDIWCAIPVLNNAKTIVDVATRCRAQMNQVVVIDDGSTDCDLTELLKSIDVSVVKHESNLGKGVALLTAFEFAAQRQAQYVLTLDGDGQHFPEDIPRFISQLSPDTILLGRRAEISGDMPRSSRLGRSFSDFWIYLETAKKVQDSQSGFRVYPLRHVQGLRMWSRHYNFEIEILTRALWAGLKVQSVPIRVWYPPASERVSSFRPLLDNLRISRAHLRLLARRLLPVRHQCLVTSSATTAGEPR